MMPDTATAQTLNQQFGIPQTVRFDDGPHGQPHAIITADDATAVLYLHGAHLTEYQPTGRKPVLFTSRQTQLKPGKPIRGGIPICFPWFGPKQGDPAAPMHGLARTQSWNLDAVHKLDDQRVQLTLTCSIDPFHVTYTVTVGTQLELHLRVHNTTPANTSASAARFEQALHTYFAVSQIRSVALAGLAGLTYLDKTQAFNRVTQGPEPVRFEGETDRVYINHPGDCTLADPAWARQIVIEKANANSTIVWNPWTDKASQMPDLGDDEWPDFVCIESGNVADNAVELAPGEAHEMSTTIRVEDL
ncbi:MAG: D-hexose-6-phosphate mutarotase [Phycisphaeraceae bacterium]